MNIPKRTHMFDGFRVNGLMMGEEGIQFLIVLLFPFQFFEKKRDQDTKTVVFDR